MIDSTHDQADETTVGEKDEGTPEPDQYVRMFSRAALDEQRKSIWPIVIGVVSLNLAVIEIAWSALEDQSVVTRGDSPAIPVRSVILAGFAVWLFTGGVAVVARRPIAVPIVRTWAIAAIVLTGPGLAHLDLTIGSTCMHLLWAIFLLVWFSRDFVKSEVSLWG